MTNRKREVAVRERKTKVDWAIEVARPLEARYACCEKMIVAYDNLKTHTRARSMEHLKIDGARTNTKVALPEN